MIPILIPAIDSIPSIVVRSWMQMRYPYDCADCDLTVGAQIVDMTIKRPVDEAYEALFEKAITNENAEYALTLEHDMVPKPDALELLLESAYQYPEYDALGALYFTKGVKGVPQIWGPPGFEPQEPTRGVVECSATGMGFTLFRLDMFRSGRLKKPWFKTTGPANGMSQDLWFWTHARKAGFRCAVDCDIRVGHYEIAFETIW